MIIIPFPRSRNRRFILKHAVRMAKLAVKTAEKHLAHLLQVQAQTMTRRGIAPEVVESELRTLENAIRAELWCVVMFGGDAA